MKKLVIFDLDGTLVDSLDSIKLCADGAIGTFGFPPFEKERYKYFVGDGAAKLIERCLIASGDQELEYFDKAFAAYLNLFEQYCMYQVEPYEGIRELLRELKSHHIQIGVLSNKPHAETVGVIETIFGKGYFDVIWGQRPEVPRKPSPEGVYRILESMKLEKEDVVYVGDTSTDMQTGKSAGLFTVGVLWGFRDREELEENNADRIIKKPSEVLDYVL